MALDLEWRVMYVKPHFSSPAQVVDRRVAVVQVADTRGVILVVQVYDMASTSSFANLILLDLINSFI
jgi:hypothetical protein